MVQVSETREKDVATGRQTLKLFSCFPQVIMGYCRFDSIIIIMIQPGWSG